MRAPKSYYDVAAYRRAISRACRKAFDPDGERAKRGEAHERFSPNQVRHTAATLLRRLYGVEAVGVILGHSSVKQTEIYAEIDVAKAERIMAEVG
jgi:integrase